MHCLLRACNRSVLWYRKLAFSRVNSFAVRVLEAIPCVTDRLVSRKSEWGSGVFTVHSSITKKAFDLVDRSSLWSKLISHGINGKLMSVIFNLYHHAKSCVRANGKMSDYFTCNVGVRQGENLSPLLFAIYLNDFESYVSRHYKGLDTLSDDITCHLSDPYIEVFLRLHVLLYADDTIVMAETPEQLQKALNAVSEYCSQWNLTVNNSKTKIVIFSRGKVRRYPDFVFGSNKLDVVDEYVYLGVKFNYNGKYKKMIQKQITQARKALYCMLAKARKLQLPIDIGYSVNCLTILYYLSYYMVVKYGGMKICCKLRYFTGNFSD